MDFRESHHAALIRQFEFLTRQKGAAFIIQLRQWWRFITDDALLRILVDEAVEEAKAVIDRFRKHEIAMADELIAVKNEMVALHPSLDDSKAQKPDGWNDPLGAIDHRHTLAHFDEVAAAAKAPGPVRLSIFGMDDDSATNELLNILGRKREEAQHFRKGQDGKVERVDENLAPALDGILLRLADARGRHEHGAELLALDKAASAGFALIRLQDFVEDLVPDPVPVKTKADVLTKANVMMGAMMRGLTDGSVSVADLRLALFAEKEEQTHKHALERWESHLRPFVERAHVDLCTRLDRRRSQLGLLRRFKARCEWHDRARLRGVGSGGNEDSLTAEFARWLFDQGLSPITKPLVGGLQPDLLESGKLYVEAKQYKAPARAYLKKGMYQLASTVTTLRGTPHEVREAFFVVFRQSGPRYVFPESVAVDGVVIYPTLIDIVPPEEAGSREKYQPRAFTEEELGAAVRGKGLDEGDADEAQAPAASPAATQLAPGGT